MLLVRVDLLVNKNFDEFKILSLYLIHDTEYPSKKNNFSVLLPANMERKKLKPP